MIIQSIKAKAIAFALAKREKLKETVCDLPRIIAMCQLSGSLRLLGGDHEHDLVQTSS